MKILFKYLFLIIVMLIAATCKKKTTVNVRLLNPALNEYVANATVVLVEKKGTGGSGIFSGNASCKEIATAVTNGSGEASFDREKLRTGERYSYFCAVKESWGVQQSYPCEGKSSGFISKGSSQDVVLTDFADANVQIQYNNVFSPGVSGDSLICSVVQCIYYDPVAGHNQGGGGIGGITIDYNTYSPFPTVSTTQPVKIYANRLIVNIRKRKLGVVSTSVDTVRAYPNQITTLQINW